MARDARLFRLKKECAIRIQARIRGMTNSEKTKKTLNLTGKLARNAFNEMQRLRIRPYVVDVVKLQGLG